MSATRKSSQLQGARRSVRAKAKVKKRTLCRANENNRVWIGVDLSLHTLALAGLGWDEILNRHVGPEFQVVRWNKNDHYFARLKALANANHFILALLTKMKMLVNLDQIYIAQEEPWPFGMAGRGKGQSQTLKQQAEISGAFLGGLLKYGYTNIYQIHNTWWRKIVADDLGITTHHSKWGRGLEGKMRPKEWALGYWNATDAYEIWDDVPEWPDLIADQKNGGRKPMPENSRARPLQPDDRYDALAMSLWMMREERNEIQG